MNYVQVCLDKMANGINDPGGLLCYAQKWLLCCGYKNTGGDNVVLAAEWWIRIVD